VHLIVANLLTSVSRIAHTAAEIAMFEPQIALAGGPDGLKQMENFCPGQEKAATQGAVMLEIGYEQDKLYRS